jgi:hypothetical protein
VGRRFESSLADHLINLHNAGFFVFVVLLLFLTMFAGFPALFYVCNANLPFLPVFNPNALAAAGKTTGQHRNIYAFVAN